MTFPLLTALCAIVAPLSLLLASGLQFLASLRGGHCDVTLGDVARAWVTMAVVYAGVAWGAQRVAYLARDVAGGASASTDLWFALFACAVITPLVLLGARPVAAGLLGVRPNLARDWRRSWVLATGAASIAGVLMLPVLWGGPADLGP